MVFVACKYPAFTEFVNNWLLSNEVRIYILNFLIAHDFFLACVEVSEYEV